MTIRVVDAMALPARAIVNRRIPKVLIVQNGTQTATDRRLVTDGIERAEWVAVLKPSTVGIQAPGSEPDGVQEVAVVTVECRPGAKLPRLLEIVHRSIPYPVVLVAAVDDRVSVSTAEKRASRSVSDQVVLQDGVAEASVGPHLDEDVQAAFFGALSVESCYHSDLQALYWYWTDVVIGLRAHAVTGRFHVPDTHERGIQRREALRSYERLAAEITTVSRQASKETQMARLVELNLELQTLRSEHEALLELI